MPASQTCTVNMLDANGNMIVRTGGYGNVDSRGKDSPVLDSRTGGLRPRRAGDAPGLKSPLAEPEVGFILPQYLGVTDEALYVCDGGNMRVVRARLNYAAQETVRPPE